MAPYRWNVLVYLAGDNDLEGAAVDDINEMEVVGSTPDVAVLTQVDRAAGFDVSNKDWRTTRRYRIQKGTSSSTIESQLVADLGETNSGDSAVVSSFFDWGLGESQASATMAVFWNHGSGFYVPPEYFGQDRGFTSREVSRAKRALRRSFFHQTREAILTQPPAIRGILYDDASMDCLDNQELEKVMAGMAGRLGRPVDVVGLDACLMSMIEVAWQVRNHARVVVGSQELEPGDGWPYDAILTRLNSGSLTGAELARAVVDEYIDSYTPSHRVTQSAIDLTRLEPLVSALDQLAGSLMSTVAATREKRAYEVFRAHRRCLKFYENNYVDVGSFASNLSAVTDSARVRTACRRVLEALQDPQGPVLAHREKGSRLDDASGLSLYLPTASRLPSDFYRDLAFAKDTRWGKLLDQLFS